VCDGGFRPHRNAQQIYCSKKSCQNERRRRWLSAKRHGDSDYRENQARVQREWGEKHDDYWRQYRQKHPEYASRNRDLARKRQKERRQREASMFAKEYALEKITPFPSGAYHITPVDRGMFAKEYAYMVQPIVIVAKNVGGILNEASLQKSTL
jgi:hypothetical protein